MALSSDLVSQFVKITKDEKEPVKETTTYGKIVTKEDGKKYVQLDGSELLTPISTTTVVDDGDRVMVTIKNHTAIVTGDLTNPSASNKDVTEIGNKITEVEILMADKVVAQDLEAINAYIENIKGITADYEELFAVTAELETLQAKYADMEYITATDVEILNAEIENLKGEFAEFTNISTDDLEAINANLTNLQAYNASFTYVSAEKLEAIEGDIKKLQTDKLDAETAKITYATIDFANINEAAIEKLFSDSGIIKDLIMSDGKVTGELVGVTIKGDIIEGGTVKADKLVILGEDGLYYKLNVDALGETTVSSDEKYQNGLDGSVIIAESITAEKIAVDDLVAFGATIGGFHINEDAIYSGVKNSISNTTAGIYLGDDGQVNIGDQNNFLKYYIDENGQYKLEIQADTLRFGASNTTIEEYINGNLVQEPISLVTEKDTELVIDDGVKIIEFSVDGKSTQETSVEGKNILPTNFSEWETGHYSYSDGSKESYYARLRVNRLIRVTPNTAYYAKTSAYYNFVIREYDSTGTFTRSIGGVESLSGGGFTTGENGYYIGVSLYEGTTYEDFETNWSEIKPFICLSSETDKTYEEYIPNSPSPDYPSEIVSVGYENLFDINSITTGYVITTAGDLSTASLFCYSDYIKVSPNETYTISRICDLSLSGAEDLMRVAYYDENYNFIERPNSSNKPYVITIPTNAHYLRLSYNHKCNSNVILTLGLTVHPYIPYGKTGIEVIHRSKNMLNISEGTVTTGNLGSYFDVVEGDIYSLSLSQTLTAAATSGNTQFQHWIRFFDASNNIIQQGTIARCDFTSVGQTIEKTSQITVPTGAVRMYLDLGCYYGGDYMATGITNYAQLEKGPEATEYESYFSNSTVFELDEPLRSLPNGVKDVAYVDHGKLYVDRYVGYKQIISSMMKSTINALTLSKEARFNKSDIENLSTSSRGIFMSNTFVFRSAGSWGYDEVGIFANAGNLNEQIAFRIPVDEDSSYFDEHPTYIIYNLETPVTDYIGEVSIPMYKDKTNVYYINDELTPYIQCEYYTLYAERVADLDQLYDDETSVLEQKIIDQKAEILVEAGTIVQTATKDFVTQTEFGTYKTEASAQMTTTAEGVFIDLNKTNEGRLDGLEDTTDDIAAKLSKHFSFTDDGLIIGSGDSAMKLRLDNEDGIIFEKANGDRVGYWDGNDFYTGNIIVRVEEKAQFGNYAYLPKIDGSLIFTRVK